MLVAVSSLTGSLQAHGLATSGPGAAEGPVCTMRQEGAGEVGTSCLLICGGDAGGGGEALAVSGGVGGLPVPSAINYCSTDGSVRCGPNIPFSCIGTGTIQGDQTQPCVGHSGYAILINIIVQCTVAPVCFECFHPTREAPLDVTEVGPDTALVPGVEICFTQTQTCLQLQPMSVTAFVNNQGERLAVGCNLSTCIQGHFV